MQNTLSRVWIMCLLMVFCCLSAGSVLAADSASSASQEVDYYTIGQGDILEVVVWQEKDLSRKVKVRVDGRISMPLVDDVLAAGRTPLELKEEIQTRLSEFIEAPEVTVIVQTLGSGTYYVLGEVKQHGEYPLEKEVTVLQALAKAQGFTDWADKKNLLLLRKGAAGEEKKIRINYTEIVSGKALEQNVALQAGDTLVVP